MALIGLTPALMAMREFPKDPTTWRQGSVYNTEWARNFQHFTSENDWCILGQGGTHAVSRGSIIFNKRQNELCVVWGVVQRTTGDLAQAQTFAELKRWTREEARGCQFVQVQVLTLSGGVITAVDPTIHEHKVEDCSDWTCLGTIEEFPLADGLHTPRTASGFADECKFDDPMFIIGINMDACRVHRFSAKLDGTCFVYGRDMACRGSYSHFAWPLAAIPKGVDKSFATALIARDVAYIEQHQLQIHRATQDGSLRWQKVFAHLGNFVSDRDGSDKPLGRIKASAGTKNEWKDFAGASQGYTLGERRMQAGHPHHGSQRMFRGVCAFSR